MFGIESNFMRQVNEPLDAYARPDPLLWVHAHEYNDYYVLFSVAAVALRDLCLLIHAVWAMWEQGLIVNAVLDENPIFLSLSG